MTAAERKRLNLMLTVLVVLLPLAAWRYRDVLMPSAETPQAGAPAPIALDEHLQGLKDLPMVSVDRPGDPEQYAPGRNLFDFDRDPKIAEEQRRQVEERRKQEEVQRKRQEEQAKIAATLPPPPPPPPPEPQPPAFRYSYIAYLKSMGKSENYIAVLKKGEGKDDIREVRVGDVIDSQFVIQKIDLDAVTITFKDERFTGKTQVLQLIKKANT